MTQEKSKTQKAVIIGGGISGLAAAALLAKQGWQVTLLEKNASLGGRARTLELNGYQFDMGPSWYLMPEVFEQFFNEFGRKTKDYYSLIRLNPRYTVFFEKEKPVTLTDDLEQNINIFEKIEPGSGKKLKAFLAKTKKVYEITVKELIYKNVWNLGELAGSTNLVTMLGIFARFPLWVSWQRSLDALFNSNHLKQILGFTSLFLGGSPAATPSIFSILAWADFGAGVWYPMGGMKKVVDALVELCREQGVSILINQEATRIKVQDNKVVGVTTSRSFFPAEVVVSAADLPWVESQLLEKKYQTYSSEYWDKKLLGISALMVYLGLNKRLPSLVHHNLYFSDDWQKNFHQVFTDKTIPSDPSMYISVRSATDRSLVPKNGEEVVILVPLGAKTSYQPDQLEKLAEQAITKAETLFDAPLKKHIVVKKLFTPGDFARDYHAYQGTALGLAHTAFQSFWWRPKHKSKKVDGLYYAGQYTNPGVGVPTSLVSAQIISRMIGFASSAQQAIFKKGSTTYYYSSIFFKGQVKQDVFVLYSYVRTIDDFVDQLEPDISSLEKYWTETVRAWGGQQTDLPIVKQFISLAKRKNFDWGWIEAFWQAMRSDLTKKKYQNFSELESYMYGSAEVIGLMMARILELPDKAMKAAAQQGKAMQLLNFIRDVAEDAELGRKYLVYEEGEALDQKKWKVTITSYLKQYYLIQKQAEKGYQYIPKKYLVPIKTAADMYTKTARIVEQDPVIVWRKKVKPQKWEVLFQLVENLIKL